MKQISARNIKGSVSAPSSKSMMQRYVALACLSNSPTTIHCPSLCDDGLASIRIAKDLGAEVITSSESIQIIPNSTIPDNAILNCAESGTSFRIFSAIAALHNKPITITGSGTLLKRPMNMIKDTLSDCKVSVVSRNGFAPLIITGPILKDKISINGSDSSQLLSGLLIACPKRNSNTEIIVDNLKSKPYVIMTLQACKDFGINISYSPNLESFLIAANQAPKASDVTVEGDWSGASFILVAAAITGEVTVTNLSNLSLQADRQIISALKSFGAEVKIADNHITVTKNGNSPFEFDATDCPDLFPPLVALAAAANGVSRIKGALRLQHKESNRALALVQEYSKIGITVIQEDDYLIVHGGVLNIGISNGATVNAHDDHRIAMSLAVTALRSHSTITIEGSESVNKSYPNFFEDLENIYE